MAKEENPAIAQGDTPPRVKPRLKSAPRIRQLYWCDLPKDAQLPEFWKRRPVIILSKNATLYGAVTVIPCSTQAQPNPKLAFALRTTIDGRAAWAVCDKPMTVAVSRLVATHGAIVRIPQDEFDEMLAVVLDLLPKPPAPDQSDT
ncbi:type II toxin-antitoxin system PemK/MazF family toxin [Pseudohoeflea coraliihabitans]|uniref:Type II toxin-antitoxin system PemK/MazF family toxin n=1 Tax=Pseudohoeflea coraliihabitans TaxID=2860393 RepID=A0ABS6WJN5_9HYPH|nr:type II toxin-antitoxin system PemK/MazF family toxin [Pseudohoeflea sp. DP4N28-3]MBW3096159.1 type II toxin-antitoxin system PemK/MazF family toxin [Pseudohoeflea sp. DP4N28-3]